MSVEFFWQTDTHMEPTKVPEGRIVQKESHKGSVNFLRNRKSKYLHDLLCS